VLPKRFDKVGTILDLLPAFPAKHHWRENLDRQYTEQMYGTASASFIYTC
jgi:hypothetical protein